MSEINKNSDCTFSAEAISYLYREMADGERLGFEDHLADCSFCIEELASLSFARLEVYEWNRDVFAHLPSPLIRIPADSSNSVASGRTWVQIKSAFQSFVSAPQWAVGGAFALLAIFAGAAFLGSRLSVINDNIASNHSVEIPAADNERVDSSITPNIKPSNEAAAVKPLILESMRLLDADGASRESKSTNEPLRVVRTLSEQNIKAVKPDPRRKQITASKRVRPTPATAAPRLNDFTDVDDNTLRLADLFADADTND